MMHQIIKTLFDAHVVMQMLWDRLAQIIQCNASVAARRPLRRTCNMKFSNPSDLNIKYASYGKKYATNPSYASDLSAGACLLYLAYIC